MPSSTGDAPMRLPGLYPLLPDRSALITSTAGHPQVIHRPQTAQLHVIQGLLCRLQHRLRPASSLQHLHTHSIAHRMSRRACLAHLLLLPHPMSPSTDLDERPQLAHVGDASHPRDERLDGHVPQPARGSKVLTAVDTSMQPALRPTAAHAPINVVHVVGVVRLPLQQRLHSICVHAPPIPAAVLLVVVLLACCCWPTAAAASAALGLLQLPLLVPVQLALSAPARVSNHKQEAVPLAGRCLHMVTSHKASTPAAWLDACQVHTLRPARRPLACPPAAAWTCVLAATAAAPAAVVMPSAASLPCASLAVVP